MRNSFDSDDETVPLRSEGANSDFGEIEEEGTHRRGDPGLDGAWRDPNAGAGKSLGAILKDGVKTLARKIQKIGHAVDNLFKSDEKIIARRMEMSGFIADKNEMQIREPDRTFTGTVIFARRKHIYVLPTNYVDQMENVSLDLLDGEQRGLIFKVRQNAPLKGQKLSTGCQVKVRIAGADENKSVTIERLERGTLANTPSKASSLNTPSNVSLGKATNIQDNSALTGMDDDSIQVETQRTVVVPGTTMGGPQKGLATFDVNSPSSFQWTSGKTIAVDEERMNDQNNLAQLDLNSSSSDQLISGKTIVVGEDMMNRENNRLISGKTIVVDEEMMDSQNNLASLDPNSSSSVQPPAKTIAVEDQTRNRQNPQPSSRRPSISRSYTDSVLVINKGGASQAKPFKAPEPQSVRNTKIMLANKTVEEIMAEHTSNRAEDDASVVGYVVKAFPGGPIFLQSAKYQIDPGGFRPFTRIDPDQIPTGFEVKEELELPRGFKTNKSASVSGIGGDDNNAAENSKKNSRSPKV